MKNEAEAVLITFPTVGDRVWDALVSITTEHAKRNNINMVTAANDVGRYFTEPARPRRSMAVTRAAVDDLR